MELWEEHATYMIRQGVFMGVWCMAGGSDALWYRWDGTLGLRALVLLRHSLFFDHTPACPSCCRCVPSGTSGARRENGAVHAGCSEFGRTRIDAAAPECRDSLSPLNRALNYGIGTAFGRLCKSPDPTSFLPSCSFF
jgi:hypothetical protein